MPRRIVIRQRLLSRTDRLQPGGRGAARRAARPRRRLGLREDADVPDAAPSSSRTDPAPIAESPTPGSSAGRHPRAPHAGPARTEAAGRQQVEERLRAAEANMRSLAARLQSVRDEERARIAREIHDELGQQLTGLKIALSGICNRLPKNQRALRQRAETTLVLIDQTIQSVRRIASGLRPSVAEQLGLAAAVEWQVREFRKRTGIRCKVTLPAAMPELDQKQATAIFWICQELLTNVARHAEATRAEVTLRCEGQALMLMVEDNGKGIGNAPLDGPDSLGFLGMRERIRPLGGTVEVDRARSSGTKVIAALPLAPH